MATFFGEVLPVTNRAYNDAEDDEEATHDFSNPFTVSYTSEDKISADIVIIACGPFATAYADALLPVGWQPVASVQLESRAEADPDVSHVRRPPPPAQLVRLTPDTCLVRCGAAVTDEHHSWLAETVLSQFESSATVIVLGSAPLAEYLSSAATYDDRPALLVRVLATRRCKLPSSLVPLEPPNVVRGTPAAVLSRCSLSGSAACLVLLYTSALRPDAETTAALHSAASAAAPSLRTLKPRPARTPADAPGIYM